MPNPRRHLLAATLLAVMTAALAAPAPATVSRGPAPLAHLVDTADIIAQGTVTRIESRREDDRITTEIDLAVIDLLKGEAGAAALTLRLTGGTYAGRTTRVLGAPCFAVGEEVVVFLVANRRRDGGAPDYHVAGMAEGKFAVERGAGGEAAVSRDLHEIHYLGETDMPDVPRTLAGLKQAVRSHLR